MMPRAGTILRQWLARHGYLWARLEAPVAPTVSSYLESVRLRTPAVAACICFDNEVGIQSQLLQALPPDKVVFASPVFLPGTDQPAPGAAVPPVPAGPFVVLIDLATFSLERLWTWLPWLARADTLLLRARLGSFWSGEIDLPVLTATIASRGFHLADVLGCAWAPALQAPSERPLLVCAPGGPAAAGSFRQRYRVNEALARLSAPIVQRRDFRLLAGRGSFGFGAGVLNPGALAEGGRTFLLARAERTPWVRQKADEARFFASAQPLLLTLGDDQQVAAAAELALEGLPDSAAARAEDFRLFRYRNEIYVNHSVLTNPRRRVRAGQPVRIESMQTRVGLSRLDPGALLLRWRGFPTIDRPLARLEKNWAMFTDGERLFLLYSLAPYVLLSAHDWPGLDFRTILAARVAWPFGGDGLHVRNSVNPVDYDARHWLHIVHKVYPNKQYCFWAVLIDKQTLLPVQATVRPLLQGWHSNAAAIVYACSVIAEPAQIRLFCGIDDSATAVATLPRGRLDAAWAAVAAPEATASPARADRSA